MKDIPESGRLAYLTSAVEEFGEIIWSVRESLEIDDLVLFGSVAQRKPNPGDIDLMILHHNQIFDDFVAIGRDKHMKDKEKFIVLSNRLGSKIDLGSLLHKTKVEGLIYQNLFNAVYMNTLFFDDANYRKEWAAKHTLPQRDKRYLLKYKELPDESFEQTIFSQGLLWNPSTKKYDTPLKQKYLT